MKIVLYFHEGAGNHGCEAIVRGTKEIFYNDDIILFSSRVYEDQEYKLTDIVKVEKCGYVDEKDRFFQKICNRLSRIGVCNNNYGKYHRIVKQKNVDVAMAIGGDTYCYPYLPEQLNYINEVLTRKQKKTVLFGCSIDEEVLKDEHIVEDLKRYSLIIARESITFENLKKSGIKNVLLAPDPAFMMKKKEVNLPEEFASKAVGINISPLICKRGREKNIAFEAYKCLVDYIITELKLPVVLLPHVVWKHDNDLNSIQQLYDIFKETNMIMKIEDNSAEVLKGYISQLRFLVGARTHATIAAYSTCVPTLVVGYSIKSKGIAKDLFGTDENYVIPVEHISEPDDLIKAFSWIYEREGMIRKHLVDIMPKYITGCNQIATTINNIKECGRYEGCN